ncbi:hypothetical protein [Actinomadura coerulea]|uniref:hypothetical protein n=1 Tax=Actinomadura coerulea TaxID=46159 RepID=UPI003433DA55
MITETAVSTTAAWRCVDEIADVLTARTQTRCHAGERDLRRADHLPASRRRLHDHRCRDDWAAAPPRDVVRWFRARLRAADIVIVLDFSFVRCAWRTLRWGRERSGYWRWVWSYRRRSLPVLMQAITTTALHAKIHKMACENDPHQPGRDHNTWMRTGDALAPHRLLDAQRFVIF